MVLTNNLIAWSSGSRELPSKRDEDAASRGNGWSWPRRWDTNPSPAASKCPMWDFKNREIQSESAGENRTTQGFQWCFFGGDDWWPWRCPYGLGYLVGWQVCKMYPSHGSVSPSYGNSNEDNEDYPVDLGVSYSRLHLDCPWMAIVNHPLWGSSILYSLLFSDKPSVASGLPGRIQPKKATKHARLWLQVWKEQRV